jgi:hypothetical protein
VLYNLDTVLDKRREDEKFRTERQLSFPVYHNLTVMELGHLFDLFRLLYIPCSPMTRLLTDMLVTCHKEFPINFKHRRKKLDIKPPDSLIIGICSDSDIVIIRQDSVGRAPSARTGVGDSGIQIEETTRNTSLFLHPVLRLESPVNLFVNAILICYTCSQIGYFVLCHILKKLICMILFSFW